MKKTEIPKGGAHVEPGEHLSASTLLTGESFWDEATFREELERFYFRSWLNVGRSDHGALRVALDLVEVLLELGDGALHHLCALQDERQDQLSGPELVADLL